MQRCLSLSVSAFVEIALVFPFYTRDFSVLAKCKSLAAAATASSWSREADNFLFHFLQARACVCVNVEPIIIILVVGTGTKVFRFAENVFSLSFRSKWTQWISQSSLILHIYTKFRAAKQRQNRTQRERERELRTEPVKM